MKVVFADVDNGLMLKKKEKLSFLEIVRKYPGRYFRDEPSQDRLRFLKVKGEK